jgi:hypothetical protein
MIRLLNMRALRIILMTLGLGLVMLLAGEPNRVSSQVGLTMTVNNPYCVQAEPASGVCLINVRNFYAVSSDPNFAYTVITINGKVRMRMTGFFETSAYLTDRMLGRGLQVTCGLPNASGIPGYGLQYQVGLIANFYGGSPVTDTAIVTCPYYQGKNYLPALEK